MTVYVEIQISSNVRVPHETGVAILQHEKVCSCVYGIKVHGMASLLKLRKLVTNVAHVLETERQTTENAERYIKKQQKEL